MSHEKTQDPSKNLDWFLLLIIISFITIPPALAQVDNSTISISPTSNISNLTTPVKENPITNISLDLNSLTPYQPPTFIDQDGIEHGQNYDIEILQDGNYRWMSAPARLLDFIDSDGKAHYIDYRIREDSNNYYYESVSKTIRFNKETCSVAVFNPNTDINNPDFLLTHTIKEAINGTDNWYIADAQNDNCEFHKTTINGNAEIIAQKGEFLTVYDINQVGSMEWSYRYKNTNETKVNNKYGFTFVCMGEKCDDVKINNIPMNDEVKLKDEIVGKNIDIDGNKFDPQNEKHDYLWAIKKQDNKMIVDFTDAKGVLGVNKTLDVDPILTFSGNNPTVDGNIRSDDTVNCTNTSWAKSTSSSTMIVAVDSANTCYRSFMEFPINLPTNAIVSKTEIAFEVVTGSANTRVCGFYDMKTYRPSTATNPNLWNEMGNGSYLTASNSCLTLGTKSVTLGSVANADVQSQIPLGWYAVGMKLDSEATDGGDHVTYIATEEHATAMKPTLTITYSMPDPPGKPSGFSQVSDTTHVNGTWTGCTYDGLETNTCKRIVGFSKYNSTIFPYAQIPLPDADASDVEYPTVPNSISMSNTAILYHMDSILTGYKTNEDYTTNNGWTQVGTAVNVDNTVADKLSFNAAPSNAEHRVYKSLGYTLDNRRFKVDSEFNISSMSSGSSAYLLWLSAGTLKPSGAQDGVGIYINHNGANYRTWALDSDGGAQSGSTIITIQPNTDYYITLERVNQANLKYSVFVDPARTIHASGSPVTYAMRSTVVGLNTIQHSSDDAAGSGSTTTAVLDNTKINQFSYVKDFSGGALSNATKSNSDYIDIFSGNSTSDPWFRTGGTDIAISGGTATFTAHKDGRMTKPIQQLVNSTTWKMEWKHTKSAGIANTRYMEIGLASGSGDPLTSTQDYIGVSQGGAGPYFYILTKDGAAGYNENTGTIASSATLYMRLERTSSTSVTLSAFTDEGMTTHASNSPQTFSSLPSTITNLNTIILGGDSQAASDTWTGTVDNLQVYDPLKTLTLSTNGLIGNSTTNKYAVNDFPLNFTSSSSLTKGTNQFQIGAALQLNNTNKFNLLSYNTTNGYVSIGVSLSGMFVNVNGTDIATASSSTSSGTWTHFAVDRNSTAFCFYKNGVQLSCTLSSQSLGSSVKNNAYFIGGNYTLIPFYGTDEIRSPLHKATIDEYYIREISSQTTVSSISGRAQYVPTLIGTMNNSTKSTSIITGESSPQYYRIALNNIINSTGGNITSSGNYVIHKFTNSGIFEFKSVGSINIEYLVVAGGGGGGFGGGGGGAGGLLHGNMSISSGSYVVTVGSGGAGRTGDGSVAGSNGTNSVFYSVTAIGGGGGASSTSGDARNGGSGGGAGNLGGASNPGTGINGQGFKGGRNSGSTTSSERQNGGGGGATSSGGNATIGIAGNGGSGYTSSISGVSTTYAGGGGGGAETGDTAGTATGGGGGGGVGSANGQSATVNTGGGGGGGGIETGVSSHNGGNGGSGIVIIKYNMLTLNGTQTGQFSDLMYRIAIPPDAPSLNTILDGNPINLSWIPGNNNGHPIDYYKIERKQGAGSYSILVANTGNVTSYNDNTCTLSLDYTYRIYEHTLGGFSPASNEDTAICGIPPDAPTGLTAVIQDPDTFPLRIKLDWNSVSYWGTGVQQGYAVYRSSNNGSSYSILASVNNLLTYIDNVPFHGNWYYKVSANSTHGQNYTSPINKTTPTIPGAPTGVITTRFVNDITRILVDWTTPVSNGGSALTGYYVQRASPGGGTYSTIATLGLVNSYNDTTVSVNTSYGYKVVARNNVGNSTPSIASLIDTYANPPTVVKVISLLSDCANNLCNIHISWTAPPASSPNVNGYKIERMLNSNGTWGILVSNTTNTNVTYDDNSRPNATRHDYRITTLRGSYISPPSTPAGNTTAYPSTAPLNLIALPLTGNSGFKLFWDTPTWSGNGTITGYKLERKVNNGAFSTLVADTGVVNTYTDTTAVISTNYQYRLFAITSVGLSPSSNTANAAYLAGALTITASSTTPKYIDIQPVVNVTFGQPLPVVVSRTLYSGNGLLQQVIDGSTVLHLGSNSLPTFSDYTLNARPYKVVVVLRNGEASQSVTLTSDTITASPLIGDCTTLCYIEARSTDYTMSTTNVTHSGTFNMTLVYEAYDGTTKFYRNFNNAGGFVSAEDLPVSATKDYYVTGYINPTFTHGGTAESSTATIPNGYKNTFTIVSKRGPNAPGQTGLEPLGTVFGLQLGFIFIIALGAVFTPRSAPMGLIIMAVAMGLMAYLGYISFDFDPANYSVFVTWALIIIAVIVGLFVGKRYD